MLQSKSIRGNIEIFPRHFEVESFTLIYAVLTRKGESLGILEAILLSLGVKRLPEIEQQNVSKMKKWKYKKLDSYKYVKSLIPVFSENTQPLGC